MSKDYTKEYYKKAAEIIMQTAANIWELQWHNSEWKKCPTNAHRTYSIGVADEPDENDVWTFRIECGVCLDCEGDKCENTCDDLSTVGVDIGWDGINKEEAHLICDIIEFNDEKFNKYWFWNDGVTK